MNWLRFGDPRIEEISSDVAGLSHELQARLAEFEKTSDPFRALTTTVATNIYEDRQEENIWRGPS